MTNIVHLQQVPTLYLVFCHGNGGSAANSISSLDAITQQCLLEQSYIKRIVCIAPDYPGSAASGGSYATIEELAIDSAETVIKQLLNSGVSPANIMLVGHSLGGYIAVCTAYNLWTKHSVGIAFVSLNSLSWVGAWVFNSNALIKLFANKYNVKANEYFEALNAERRFVAHYADDDVITLLQSLILSLAKNEKAKTCYAEAEKEREELRNINKQLNDLLNSSNLTASQYAEASNKLYAQKVQLEKIIAENLTKVISAIQEGEGVLLITGGHNKIEETLKSFVMKIITRIPKYSLNDDKWSLDNIYRHFSEFFNKSQGLMTFFSKKGLSAIALQTDQEGQSAKQFMEGYIGLYTELVQDINSAKTQLSANNNVHSDDSIANAVNSRPLLRSKILAGYLFNALNNARSSNNDCLKSHLEEALIQNTAEFAHGQLAISEEYAQEFISLYDDYNRQRLSQPLIPPPGLAA